MMLTEGGRGKDKQMVAESAFNRADYMHWSIARTLNKHFYGTYGKWPGAEQQLLRNPKLRAQMDSYLNGALAGSDMVKGSTDQGMLSDPNGHYIFRHDHVWGPGDGNIYGDWGGGRGHAAAENWRHEWEAHTGDDVEGAPSGAIAGGGAHTIHLHHTTTLDGRTVAKNSMKHIAREGNRPARAGRLSDPFATVPLSI